MKFSGGNKFAGYTILKALGAGGMGEVYLAQHPRLPRQDALKLLPDQLSTNSDYRERFLREANIAATLWHPNIVRVNDRGETDGQLWIAMDYIDGSDAAHLMSRYPAGISADEVAAIVGAVADALDYAHQHGLLHRDVKPANILLTKPNFEHKRRILLGDFGIARTTDDISGLTITNATVGTVAYAAPEQLLGEQIDGRADQYALAASAYHLLTGSQLFPNSNPAVVISHHLSTPPAPLSRLRPDLSGLDSVLAKALSKNPRDRYSRCSEFARDFFAHTRTLNELSPSAPTAQAPTPPPPPVAPKPQPAPTPSPQRRGSSRVAVLISLVTLLLAVAAGITVWRDHQRTTTATSTPTASPPPVTASAAPLSTAALDPNGNKQDSLLPVSNGETYIITRSGKTACRITSGNVECYVQFNANADRENIDGRPVTGVSITPTGSLRWLVDGRQDYNYTPLEYGAKYHALNWTIKPYSQGTIFINDTTGIGMMVSAQGFTTIQPGNPTDQGDGPTEGRACTDKDKIVPSDNGELVCDIISTGPWVLQWKRFTTPGLETVTRGANCAPAETNGDFRFARSTDDYLVWCVGYSPNARWVPYQP